MALRKFGTGEVLPPDPEDKQGLTKEASEEVAVQTPQDRAELARENEGK